MTRFAHDVFYYGGRTYRPGDEIEPSSAADLKALEDKGLIGKEKPNSEETKVNPPSEANKGKAKP